MMAWPHEDKCSKHRVKSTSFSLDASVSTLVKLSGWRRASWGPSSSDTVGFSMLVGVRQLFRIKWNPSGGGLPSRGETHKVTA